MRSLAALIVLKVLFGWPVDVAFSQQELRPGHANFEGLPAGLAQKFMRSVVENEKFAAGVLKTPEIGNDQLYSIWRANRIDWSARVDAVSLVFSARQQGESAAPSAENSFGVRIKFDEEGKSVTLRSDSPASKKYLGGLRFSFNQQRNWAAVLPGRPGRSLLAIAPRVVNEVEKALFVCPLAREPQATPTGGATPLPIVSNYQLQKASFEVSAHALARLNSGPGAGWARAAILTSPNIPNTEPFLDEAFARDPRVNLEYTANGKDEIEEQIGSGPFVGAVKVHVFLQNNAGYVRDSSNQEVVWVEPFDNSLALQALRDGAQVTHTPQHCVLVLKAAVQGHTYSKQAVLEPTPESVQVTPTALAN